MLNTVNNKKMLSDEAYSLGKSLAQLYIPALSTLYFTLANIWAWPDPGKVTGTLAAIAAFLGLILKLSSSNYDKSGAALIALDSAGVKTDIPVGTMNVVNHTDGTRTFSLDLDGDPTELDTKDSITFKVNKEQKTEPKTPAVNPNRGKIHHKHEEGTKPSH